MLKSTNINGLTVQIIAFGGKWLIFADNQIIKTGAIKTGKELVNYCNQHNLIVDNPDCLRPSLRNKLNNHN